MSDEFFPVLDFLQRLLNTPSPVGLHEQAIALVEESVRALPLPEVSLTRTVKGALQITLPGLANDAPRALSAHVDTLGAMVREVKPNGRLLLTQLGGYAWNAVEGENVTVHCLTNGLCYRGTIQTIAPSIHTNPEHRSGAREEERMEVRLDVRTSSADETRSLGIEVGDFCSFDPRVELTETGYIKSRHLDDKAGVAVLYGVLRTLSTQSALPAQRTTWYISNYEEVGHGAASGIPTDVTDLLVVDMAASTTGEHQHSDEYSVGICAKDSSGPYDIGLRQKLVRLASEQGIPFKIDTYPSYGSDGSAYLRAGGNVRVGLIGPGVDASHAYERTHRDSLWATIRLATAFVLAE
ncbi:MAG: M42 family metallopeptidase [Anaerolineales bacterium]